MVDGVTAPRLRRPSWRDPRLGVGVVLVAASVALGSWVLSRSDDTISVYSARDVLSPGDPLDPAALEVVQVQLPGSADLYLSADEPLPADAVVVRTIDAGELVPGSAVGATTDVDVRPVSLPVSAAMETYLTKGARVDLWVALPDEDTSRANQFLAPELLAENVEVWDIHEDTSLFAGADQVQVQVLVDVDRLPDVLEAVSSGGEITVVPLPGAAQTP